MRLNCIILWWCLQKYGFTSFEDNKTLASTALPRQELHTHWTTNLLMQKFSTCIPRLSWIEKAYWNVKSCKIRMFQKSLELNLVSSYIFIFGEICSDISFSPWHIDGRSCVGSLLCASPKLWIFPQHALLFQPQSLTGLELMLRKVMQWLLCLKTSQIPL